MSDKLKEIKKEQMKLRKESIKMKSNLKAKENALLLTTLIGELESNSKRSGVETSDNDVIALIKKFIKGNKDTMDAVASTSAQYEHNSNEIKFLESFLPQQMSEEDLMKIVLPMVEKLNPEEKNMRAMGAMMSYLKTHYSGQYDNAMASKIIKGYLV